MAMFEAMRPEDCSDRARPSVCQFVENAFGIKGARLHGLPGQAPLTVRQGLIAAVEHTATLRWAARRRPPPESTCESPILSPPPAVLSFPRNSASLGAFTPVFDDGGRN